MIIISLLDFEKNQSNLITIYLLSNLLKGFSWNLPDWLIKKKTKIFLGRVIVGKLQVFFQQFQKSTSGKSENTRFSKFNQQKHMFSDLPDMFFWNCWKKTWSLPTMTCPRKFLVFFKLTNQVNHQYFKLVFF